MTMLATLPPRCRAWAAALAASVAVAAAPAAFAQDAAALHARHDALLGQLASSPFKRPLLLESTQNASDLRGDVYAVVAQPYAVVAPALQGADQWCELLILHLNVKGCTSAGKPPAATVSIVVGRKFDQPLDDGYKVDLAYSVPAAGADYLRVQMAADEGPMGTKDYRLALEAIPLDGQHSFVHLSYAYAYGLAARLAMQGYLATAGRDKIGFSVTGQGDNGKPVYITGVRGVVERNTMRYYLAIEAYLSTLSTPPAERLAKRLADWYDSTERHAPQLHEISRDDYLAMKRREVQRQQGAKADKPG